MGLRDSTHGARRKADVPQDDVADLSELVNKNPELLQGKITYLTKRKSLYRDKDTGKFTNESKKAKPEEAYAKGPVSKRGSSSDEDDLNSLPKKKRNTKTPTKSRRRSLSKALPRRKPLLRNRVG